MSNDINNRIEHRLTKLETQMKEIMENHLPHIQKRLNWVFGLVVVGILVPILMYVIDKSGG